MTVTTSNPVPFGSYPSLVDRPVLVTGGATGIGAAMVTRFAALGARLAFVDRNRQAGEALVTALAPIARHLPVFAELDLTDLDTIGPAIAQLSEAVGPITVLVNNAAHDERHTIEAVTPAFWRDRLAVNLDHQFFCIQAVLPGMKTRGGGAIINMGSASYRLALGGMPAYVTAKAAIEGLTRSLARDVGPYGIRVTCIVPGFVKTERQVKKWLTPELEAAIYAGQCLKELIEPSDIAALAAFLASDDARMLTNQAYVIDAGWT